MKPSVIVVGVLDKVGSTDIDERDALEALGWETYDFNYRNYGEQFEVSADLLIDKTKHIKPDLVYLCKIERMPPECIDELNKVTKTIYLIPDPMFTCEDIKCLEFAKRATWASCTSKEVYLAMKKVNPRTIQVFEGYNPKVFRPLNMDKIIDVGFVGSIDDKRKEYLDHLSAHHINIEIHTPQNPIYGAELNEFFNKCKMVLNFCRSNIFSNRVVEVMGSGSLLLTDRCDDIVDTFENGRELVYFDTPAELVAQIQVFSKIDCLRKKIALRGIIKVLHEFTWRHQLGKIINYIQSHASCE